MLVADGGHACHQQAALGMGKRLKAVELCCRTLAHKRSNELM